MGSELKCLVNAVSAAGSGVAQREVGALTDQQLSLTRRRACTLETDDLPYLTRSHRRSVILCDPFRAVPLCVVSSSGTVRRSRAQTPFSKRSSDT